MAPVSEKEEKEGRCLSRKEVKKATINAWMLEYAASEIWGEFEEDRKAGASSRDYLQALLERSIRDNVQDRFNSLLVYFLCTLDGGGSDIELEERFSSLGGDDSEDEVPQPSLVTPLENAFCIFQLMRKELNEQDSDAESLALELREQAILTCCRLDQFDIALRVYEASLEFKPFMQSDKSARKRIRYIIKSRDSSHAYLEERPYSKLLDMAADYLRPKCQDLEEPFLSKIAEKVLDKEGSAELEEGEETAVGSTSGGDMVITGSIFAKLVQHFGFEDEPEKWQEVSPSLEKKRKQLSARKKELLRSMPDIVARHINEKELLAAAAAEDAVEDDTDDDDNFPSPPPPPPQRPSSRIPKRLSAQRARTAVMSNVDERSGSDLEQEPSTTVPSVLPSRETSLRFPLPSTSSSKRDWDTSSMMSSVTGAKRRRPWSMQEEVALCRAVKKYGIGNWAAIKNNCHDFPLRTNIDLKDKWRGLVKSGRAGNLE